MIVLLRRGDEEVRMGREERFLGGSGLCLEVLWWWPSFLGE